MINPVIFSFKILSFEFALRWYGVIIMLAVVFVTWWTARRLSRLGGDPEMIWDALLVILIAGIVGARLWYVINATLGGSRYYLDNPLRIFNIPEGGLHIYGAFLLGGLAAYLYLRKKKGDFWMLLDAVAPGLLIGQAIGRLGNFINQELYGPPTSLPWGISIAAKNRMAPWNDLAAYPLETTRFHPTFAYEMLWNLLAAGLLLGIEKQWGKKLKPGTTFIAWLILAGVGRFLIEAFRPDQPLIPGASISFSRLIAGLMALFGMLWMLARYNKIKLPGLSHMPEKYKN